MLFLMQITLGTSTKTTCRQRIYKHMMLEYHLTDLMMFKHDLASTMTSTTVPTTTTTATATSTGDI